MGTRALGLVIAAAVAMTFGVGFGRPVRADDAARVPVLVPLTGFLSLEGASQRDGALLALSMAARDVATEAQVIDTATAPETAVTALERALADGAVPMVAASMLGSQMLAMMPMAKEYEVPLITVSGTAAITERGNPWVFRFFPGDAVTKTAQARYAVEKLKVKRPAVIYQTTAYGQSGHRHLVEKLGALGVAPVFEEAVDTSARDLSPVIANAMAAEPDALLLHLHAASTALFVRQARAQGIELPIVAGSALHQPSTAALLEPEVLRGVCAETAASPVSGDSHAMRVFTEAYRERFGTDPDAFALGQYDGMTMALRAMARGAKTPKAVRDALASESFTGLAMTYRSDGTGDMAHSAVIICYDGRSRVPEVALRYDVLPGR